MARRSWRRSLRKALRRYYQTCAARWPEVYRQPSAAEIGKMATLYAPLLTGPVQGVGVSGNGKMVHTPDRWEGHYSPYRLGGGVNIYCRW